MTISKQGELIMSQIPPTQPPAPGYGYPPGASSPRPRTSGAAIASLVLGILGCIPLLTSLLAVVFGIVGIRKTRDPMTSGRGMAIAGLVLGLVGIIGWSLISGLYGYAYVSSGPARQVARQFMTDMDAGRIDAAAQNASLTVPELDKLAEHMKSKGPITSMSFTSFFVHTDTSSGTTCKLVMMVSRSNGVTVYEIDLAKTGGKWIVQSVVDQQSQRP
jgi:hypothetical protein